MMKRVRATALFRDGLQREMRGSLRLLVSTKDESEESHPHKESEAHLPEVGRAALVELGARRGPSTSRSHESKWTGDSRQLRGRARGFSEAGA